MTWILLVFVAHAVAAAPPGPGPQIGSNLGFLSDNSGEWPFVDVFKTSSGWFQSGACGWQCDTLDLDANGWVRSLDPGEMAHAFIFTNSGGRMPHGPGDDDTYVILYDGVGVLDYDGVSEVVSQSPGRDVVRVDPASQDAFSITLLRTAATFDPEEVVDPDDYIQNLRVIAPGGVCSNDPFQACMSHGDCAGTCDSFEQNHAQQIFHPTFLNNVRNYDVLRLMDWMQTIEAPVSSYADYPTPSSARWNQAPAAIMAELANRLDVDIWINIPHNADQSLIDGLAADLATNLSPSRKLYLEYSNEVWNPAFPAYTDGAVAGCSIYSDLTDACDQDQTAGNGLYCEGHAEQPIPACDTARKRFTSSRSKAIWTAFEDAFDQQLANSGDGRIVRVLASWNGNTTLHDELLSFEDTYLEVDAFATAGYFGWPLGGDPVVQSWNPQNPSHMDALFTRLATEVQTTLDDMAADRQFLLTPGPRDYSSIPLVFYEGGQGLFAWGANEASQAALDHANALFDAANRDPRMADRYQELLDGWRQRAGDVLFNHYKNCQAYRPWDRYGALEHQRQPHGTSPKYTALMNFISGLP